MKKKTKSRLAVKFVLGFVILGLLICATSSTIGYHQYKSNIEKQYNETAYNIANQAITYIDNDLLAEYVSLIKRNINGEDVSAQFKRLIATEEYQSTRNDFFALRKSMGANDIFLVYVDGEEMSSYNGSREGWTPVNYIYDSYAQEDLSYVLGNQGTFNPDYILETQNILKTGQRSDSYFISKSQYGYNTYAMQPVKLGDDILLLGVEVPMTTIESALTQYVLFAVCVSVAIIIFVIIIYMAYIYKTVIKPINTIAEESGKFIENGNIQSAALDEINTNDEIKALSNSILKMQNDIKEHINNITRITAERERIGAELDLANNIQTSMLPCIFPAFPDREEFDVYATMTPAKEVGGDFYDYFLIDDDHLALVIADVSGKGVPAALFMMISKTLIKSTAQSGLSPKEILEKVNDQLCENNEAQMFVTVWIGIVELSTGIMRCANAGHEYPAIYRTGSGFELYRDKHGFVLAGMEGLPYSEYEITLKAGDIVYVYTDGVAEATDLSNNLYGVERMVNALNNCPEKTPDAIDKYLRRDIDSFVGSAEQFDDITMLCFKYSGKNPSSENELSLEADEDNLYTVLDFVNEKLGQAGASEEIKSQLDIAVEEIFVNIAKYAYGDKKGMAAVKFSYDEKSKEAVISLEDNGMKYNPLEKSDPDITLSAQEREIGGLGIFMAKKFTDKMEYSYENETNILKITKKIL